MLKSKNLAIVKDFGDKIEFTIARFHCISNCAEFKNKVIKSDELDYLANLLESIYAKNGFLMQIFLSNWAGF